jgi:DNA gyrase/topoisomerase IV subunit A
MNGQDDSLERLRLIESRYGMLRDRMIIVNQNMIEEYKKLNQEIRILDSEIKDMKKDVVIIKDALNAISREMRNFSKIEDFKVLEKYINFWNPLKFVTEEDVFRIIKEKRGVKNITRKKSKSKGKK